MTKIINLTEKLPKNTTVAIIDREDNTLKAFLSTETTKTRYCFTQKIDMMCLISASEADTIVDDLYSSFESTGIRTFDEDTKTWSITPISEIKFVAAPVGYEK